MQSGQGMRIGMIGFGEVGHVFAKGLLAGGATIAAYDLLFDDPEAAAAATRDARSVGVVPAATNAEACEGADIIFSCVTASQALAVARKTAGSMRAGQVFFDVNSVSPATKRAAAEAVEAAGADYVEGAVMAPVLGPDLKVPILGAGRRAGEIAERLNALGMNIRPVATEIGRASATKLCRSIMIKGLEALIIDCTRAAAAFGVTEDVFKSFYNSYPGMDWDEIAATMPGRVEKHGLRRAAEMREVAAMLRDLGMDGSLADAVADRHERYATIETKRARQSEAAE
ncbi:NAD(P)-dependent oxidoreductase [Propylenella binzhouense]|nr:NAD(P)-binding domain-containing protein [Propylenella binzhouense]